MKAAEIVKSITKKDEAPVFVIWLKLSVLPSRIIENCRMLLDEKSTPGLVFSGIFIRLLIMIPIIIPNMEAPTTGKKVPNTLAAAAMIRTRTSPGESIIVFSSNFMPAPAAAFDIFMTEDYRAGFISCQS
jgi:hypothetical protein